MEISYGVVWRESALEQQGRLAVRDDGLELIPHEDGGIERRVPFEEIEWIEVRPPGGEKRENAAVIIKLRSDGEIAITSAVDRWIVGDLAGKVFEHGLAPGGARRRMLLTIDGGHRSDLHMGLGF